MSEIKVDKISGKTSANAVTVTSKTNIGNDNTISSGEHLFEDMGNRQFFKHGIITEKPSKQ